LARRLLSFDFTPRIEGEASPITEL